MHVREICVFIQTGRLPFTWVFRARTFDVIFDGVRFRSYRLAICFLSRPAPTPHFPSAFWIDFSRFPCSAPRLTRGAHPLRAGAGGACAPGCFPRPVRPHVPLESSPVRVRSPPLVLDAVTAACFASLCAISLVT